MELCIIIDINVCGLINVVEMLLLCSLKLSNPYYSFGVRHPTEYVECSPLPFYIFLDADITFEDPQVGQGGLQDALGAS